MTLGLSHGAIQRYGRNRVWYRILVMYTMLDVIAIIITKVTSQCADTVQMREESDSGIRNCEEM